MNGLPIDLATVGTVQNCFGQLHELLVGQDIAALMLLAGCTQSLLVGAKGNLKLSLFASTLVQTDFLVVNYETMTFVFSSLQVP